MNAQTHGPVLQNMRLVYVGLLFPNRVKMHGIHKHLQGAKVKN